jgi:23S rRNA pseudouridine1911/1915/1917 synthase
MQCRVSPADAGLRLDVWLAARHPGVTRSQVRRWIDLGRVRVNEAVEKAGYTLHDGDAIAWEMPEPSDPDSGPRPENIPFGLIYQDPDIVVVDKPPGMVVHPGAGVSTGTLVGALKGRGIPLAPTGGPFRPGIVHRLDKGTSGLLIVASTDRAYQALVAAIAGRLVHRRYRALVWGRVPEEEGVLTGDINRSRSDRRRMAVVTKGGRHAVTHYKVRERHRFLTDLDLELETGRTHQIRVHWRHQGHPVFGDPEYGGRSRGNGLSATDRALAREWLELVDRQALHARGLEFDHPLTGERLSFEAPLPPDLQRLYLAVAGGNAGTMSTRNEDT